MKTLPASTMNASIRPRRNAARSWRRVGLLLCFALVCAACGLSPGAATNLAQAQARGSSTGFGGGTSGSTGSGGVGSSTSGSAGSGGVGSGTSGSTGSGGVGNGATAGGSGGVGSGTTSGGSGGSGTAGTASASYEQVGITSTTINIGIHAPETGAAPIPLQAFATGAKLFWENHTVFGHQVVMTFMDDQYNPSVARQVCETMSRQDFLVMGAAGTDQIQACATDPVLAQSHTPYVSDGVTTNGLTNLPYYFAISQTYAAQSPEVFTMVAQLYGADAKKTWAVVTENTPNFSDAQASIDSVLAKNGVHYCNIPTPKYFSEQDATNAITAAKSCGATVVYLDIDPNFWIDMVREAQAQLFTPDWVGPGLTNGEDLVAGPVCAEQPQIKAAFLSPYPGLDRQPPGFTSESNPAPDTPASERDLEMDIYGVSEVIYYAMLSVGSIQKLTRDNLIAAMQQFHASYGPQLTVYPTVNFAGHFGGTGAWEEQLNCSQTAYTTAGLLYG
ncbi:MAG: ABC transporter substrate-binding protein [Acidimicrobiales bacterium]